MSVSISLTEKEAEELMHLLDDLRNVSDIPDEQAMADSVCEKTFAAYTRPKRRRPATHRRVAPQTAE
ncbi:hypothetical protein [Curtobacterium sp. MCBD17_040]|uniref:hypothetical protein n=1 Tax=Curtobacterium sp. MCBD17_040 TaxID=2175674 RepID=UPI000DA8ADA6|nr:hypothetical protein [Curtobacterium sp. MCBD17_040]WIB65445.1 hypothetical protein DEI94_18790 [Curtobacterium sp. MCBD17_040]